MSTIDNKKMIDEMIAADGYYMDDPRIHKIVEYTNAYGVVTWGVTWVNNPDKEKYMLPTFYVRNPKVIWEAK